MGSRLISMCFDRGVKGAACLATAVALVVGVCSIVEDKPAVYAANGRVCTGDGGMCLSTDSVTLDRGTPLYVTATFTNAWNQIHGTSEFYIEILEDNYEIPASCGGRLACTFQVTDDYLSSAPTWHLLARVYPKGGKPGDETPPLQIKWRSPNSPSGSGSSGSPACGKSLKQHCTAVWTTRASYGWNQTPRVCWTVGKTHVYVRVRVTGPDGNYVNAHDGVYDGAQCDPVYLNAGRGTYQVRLRLTNVVPNNASGGHVVGAATTSFRWG